jgi:hypothetical protein
LKRDGVGYVLCLHHRLRHGEPCNDVTPYTGTNQDRIAVHSGWTGVGVDGDWLLVSLFIKRMLEELNLRIKPLPSVTKRLPATYHGM